MAEAGHASRSDTNLLSDAGTHHRNASTIQHLEFHQIIAFQTSVNCHDIAVTRDDQVLLAALQFGMLVYNSNGIQLPSWLPPRQGNRDDVVSCVAALRDGRVAVGLGCAQLVVMLRLSHVDNLWQEENRVTVHSPPMRVAAYGDVIAAANMTLDDTQGQQPKIWLPGCNLQILRLSTGTELCRPMTEYNIERIALTAYCVVITSSGREREVMEALSHAGEHIWRHTLDQDEIVEGISAAHRWSSLYVCIVNKNLRSSRVMEISGVDGYEIRQIESLRTHGMLSVMSCEQRTVTAVLKGDPMSNHVRNVTLYGTMNHLPNADDLPSLLRFAGAPVRFETAIICYDIAVTQDGRVLLAGVDSGLLVYGNNGQLLYTWKPAKQCNGSDDLVWYVAALSNRIAAVGVQHAQLVVLLKSSNTGDSWQEERRVTVPKPSPCRLAVHDDLIAVSYFRGTSQSQERINCDRVATLHNISSGKLRYIHSRDYDIARIALTARCIVTTGVTKEVIEAFSHSETLLWRYEAGANETILGLCVTDNRLNLLFATVAQMDLSSGKVMALGLADGKDSREALSSSTLGLLVPRYVTLSQGEHRTVLALLNHDRRTVLLNDAVEMAIRWNANNFEGQQTEVPGTSEQSPEVISSPVPVADGF